MERKKHDIGQSAQLFWKVSAYGIRAKVDAGESPELAKLTWNLALEIVIAYRCIEGRALENCSFGKYHQALKHAKTYATRVPTE
jgi:hypothetical protein